MHKVASSLDFLSGKQKQQTMSRIIQRDEVIETTFPDPDEDIDDKMVNRDLTMGKSKRGRPRKVEHEPEPVVVEAAPAAPENKDEAERMKRLAKKRTMAIQLKKKLNAVGTGLNVETCQDESLLDAEIEALDNDINQKRGNKAIKGTFLFFVEIIEKVASATIPGDQLDIGKYPFSVHLKQEVSENWELFDEAAQHLAIRYADWFSVGPIGELGQGLAGCVNSCNNKNQARRKEITAKMEASKQAATNSEQ